MTFVQPHKNNLTAMNITIFVMVIAAITVSASGMFLYNQLVNLRHDFGSSKNYASKAEVENAELKNALYRAVDPKNFAVIAESHSLVAEKNPEFLKTGPQVSSNY